MYSQQVSKKCCSAMNVKIYARIYLHISMHAIIYITTGNKWTVILCTARANNWCLILRLLLMFISLCPSFVHEGSLVLPLETQSGVLGTRLTGCTCVSASRHSWATESWHFPNDLQVRKKYHCVMRKMTRSKCSYLFCNSFLSLIMATHLRVLKRFKWNLIFWFERH